MFDLKMLTEPAYDTVKFAMIQPSDDADWHRKSKVAFKDTLKDVQTAWSKSLVGRSPAIAEFLQRFALTADDVSSFAYEIRGKGRDPAEVARKWVDANPDRIDVWPGL
jgi:glycine betaine/proline transport system substrate-binding protein